MDAHHWPDVKLLIRLSAIVLLSQVFTLLSTERALNSARYTRWGNQKFQRFSRLEKDVFSLFYEVNNSYIFGVKFSRRQSGLRLRRLRPQSIEQMAQCWYSFSRYLLFFIHLSVYDYVFGSLGRGSCPLCPPATTMFLRVFILCYNYVHAYWV